MIEKSLGEGTVIGRGLALCYSLSLWHGMGL